MKALFAAILILFGCASKAEPILMLMVDDNTLTLANDACNPVVSELLNPKRAAEFRDASAVVAGKTIAACWIVHDAETFYVRFADGSRVMIESNRFSRITPTRKNNS